MLDVADKLLIQELLSRAAYGLDTHNLDRIEACFTPDATFTLHVSDGSVVGPFEGREAIMGLMSGAIEVQTDVRKHGISNFFIEKVDGDSVHVVSNLTLVGTENEVNRLITTGVYHDQVKKVDGQWGIALRRLDLDMPF